jgi:HCNGP-like protein
MSALVGYGSSSDEEEIAVAVPAKGYQSDAAPTLTKAEPPAEPSDQTANSTQDKAEYSNAPRPIVGPMQGPTAPTNGEMLDGGSQTPVLEHMSERDKIRYLMQAPIPMTSIPPSPPGSPDPAANARFARFLELKAKGVHFNEDLARKSNFLNPGLLSTMMARAGLDEEEQYNTSLPLDLWDPTSFPEWAYKEGLSKSQQEIRQKDEADKKVLSAAGKRTIEFAASGGNSGSSSRKSTPGYQNKRRRP